MIGNEFSRLGRMVMVSDVALADLKISYWSWILMQGAHRNHHPTVEGEVHLGRSYHSRCPSSFHLAVAPGLGLDEETPCPFPRVALVDPSLDRNPYHIPLEVVVVSAAFRIH